MSTTSITTSQMLLDAIRGASRYPGRWTQDSRDSMVYTELGLKGPLARVHIDDPESSDIAVYAFSPKGGLAWQVKFSHAPLALVVETANSAAAADDDL
jgi:hypothetical protein